jgi:hypothetical protein
MSLELWTVMHFLWLTHAPNQVIHSELEQVDCNDVITLSIIEKWTTAFETGRSDLADLPRYERPRDTGKVDAVRALVESEG